MTNAPQVATDMDPQELWKAAQQETQGGGYPLPEGGSTVRELMEKLERAEVSAFNAAVRTGHKQVALNKAEADIATLTARVAELEAALTAADMAKTRLDIFADQANAGLVQYNARELKRRVFGAFSEFRAVRCARESSHE